MDSAVVEMTTEEKTAVDYATSATIYVTADKVLLTGQDGADWVGNTNVLINPTMPTTGDPAMPVPLYLTKVVDNAVVEITDAGEIATATHTNELLPEVKTRDAQVAAEIRTRLSADDELALLRKLASGEITTSDPEVISWNIIANAAKLKFPKPT